MHKLDKFAGAGAVHGVKYILGSNYSKITRFIWTLALLLSIGGFFFYIRIAYQKLMFQPEHVIKITDRKSSDYPAPAITICSNLFARNNIANIADFYKTYNKQFKRGLKVNLTKKQCVGLTANIHWCQPAFSSHVMNVCSDAIYDEINVLDYIDDSSHLTSDVFFTCSENRCDKLIRVFTDSGICYTINSLSYSTLFNTDNIDEDFKWFERIVKNSNQEELSKWSPESGYSSPNQTYPMRANSNMDHFTFFPILSAIDKNNSYTKALCEWECKTNLTLEKCGCVKFPMPRSNTTKICKTSQLKCVIEVDSPNCDCYVPCNDVTYSYKVDFTTFNRELYRNVLRDDDVASWVQFEIEEIVEETEKFMTYKLQNFISDFGGLLGLFMGCSLLSIVEIFFYITIGFHGFCANIKHKIHPEQNKTWASKVLKVEQGNEILKELNKLSMKLDENTKESNRNILKVKELLSDYQKNNNKRLEEIERRITRLEIYDVGL